MAPPLRSGVGAQASAFAHAHPTSPHARVLERASLHPHLRSHCCATAVVDPSPIALCARPFATSALPCTGRTSPSGRLRRLRPQPRPTLRFARHRRHDWHRWPRRARRSRRRGSDQVLAKEHVRCYRQPRPGPRPGVHPRRCRVHQRGRLHGGAASPQPVRRWTPPLNDRDRVGTRARHRLAGRPPAYHARHQLLPREHSRTAVSGSGAKRACRTAWGRQAHAHAPPQDARTPPPSPPSRARARAGCYGARPGG